MDLYQLWAMALAIIGSIFSMGGVLYWMIARLDNDVKTACDRIDKIGLRLDGHAVRIDHLYQISSERMDQLYLISSQRTDELHRMFYELLKEGRK